MLSIMVSAQETGRSKTGGLTPKQETKPETVITNPLPQTQETKQEYYTPFLQANLVYSEPSGNNFLDANEEGKIILTIKNIGKLPAEDLDVKMIPSVPDKNIEISGLQRIPLLDPDAEITIEIKIKPNQSVKTDQKKYNIKIIEKNGFDLDPEKVLIIPVREYQPPIVEIVDYGIEDQNRNLKIEKFEKVDITVRIQNRGESAANDIKAKILLGENVIALDVQEEYQLGDLKTGEYKDIKAVVVTNARATEVRFDVSVSESTKLYGTSRSIVLPLDVIQKKPDEIIIATGETQTITIPEVMLSKLDIAENIPIAENKKENAVAVIIGNKDYTSAPKVSFALNDAMIIKNYVQQTLGYKEENIIYVENAKQSDLTSIFGNEGNYRGRLYDFARKGLSEVFIYYSGHGAPEPESKQGFLVPVDCDPNKVALNGYSLKTLYTNLDKIAKEKELVHVTMVLDACFSGNSEAGSLMKNISPIYISVEKQGMSYPNTSIFTSATGDQVSNWYPDKKQSLFTYFFLKGLKGEADLNKNGEITTEELHQFTADEINGVPYWSRRISSGRTQTPTFSGTDYVIYK